MSAAGPKTVTHMESRSTATQAKVRFEADVQECIRRIDAQGRKYVPTLLRECLSHAEDQGRTMMYALLLVAAEMIEETT